MVRYEADMQLGSAVRRQNGTEIRRAIISLIRAAESYRKALASSAPSGILIRRQVETSVRSLRDPENYFRQLSSEKRWRWDEWSVREPIFGSAAPWWPGGRLTVLAKMSHDWGHALLQGREAFSSIDLRSAWQNAADAVFNTLMNELEERRAGGNLKLVAERRKEFQQFVFAGIKKYLFRMDETQQRFVGLLMAIYPDHAADPAGLTAPSAGSGGGVERDASAESPAQEASTPGSKNVKVGDGNRGPDRDDERARNMARIVREVTENGYQAKMLEKICEALDAANFPRPPTWSDREPALGSWSDAYRDGTEGRQLARHQVKYWLDPESHKKRRSR